MLKPLDIEKQTFKSSLAGYSKSQVDRFMNQIEQDYEKIYMENIEMKDKISILNDGLKHYKIIEETLQKTLLTAEKAASELKDAAHKKAEQIELEATNRASAIINEAKEKVYDLNLQIDRLIMEYDSFKTQIKYFYESQIEIINNSKVSDKRSNESEMKFFEE